MNSRGGEVEDAPSGDGQCGPLLERGSSLLPRAPQLEGHAVGSWPPRLTPPGNSPRTVAVPILPARRPCTSAQAIHPCPSPPPPGTLRAGHGCASSSCCAPSRPSRVSRRRVDVVPVGADAGKGNQNQPFHGPFPVSPLGASGPVTSLPRGAEVNRPLLGDRSAPEWGPVHLVDLLVVRRLRERPPRPQPERVVEGRRLDVRFQLAMEVLRGRSRRKGDHRPPTDRVLLGRALGHVELPGQRPASSQEIPNVLAGGGGQGAVRVQFHAQFDGGALVQDGRPGPPSSVKASSPLLSTAPLRSFPGIPRSTRGEPPLVVGDPLSSRMGRLQHLTAVGHLREPSGSENSGLGTTPLSLR